ncbi:phage major tail tube protein [Chitiniphilus eburneus]|uniref:phage major tail tube protein n=1 Tax=Chitiniphilus eburneus TaxID=2571148 RepID=UPI0035D0B6DA
MALPRILTKFNVFHNGTSHLGEVAELVLPKLTRKVDEYRGGGMGGPVDLDLGNEKLELEATYGGWMYDILLQYGIAQIDGVLMRFAGAVQRQDTGENDAVEIVVRGRHVEIDPGSAKAGEKGEFKVKSSLSYYKLVVNNVTLIEIDHINLVFVVGGTDLYAAQRRAIGL